MSLFLQEISDIINSEITTEQELIVVSESVKRTRSEISSLTGVPELESFAGFFKQLGVTTQLRDDDISPLARRKRIENYITVVGDESENEYRPGFAAQALIDGLGYQFSIDGKFISGRENCIVLKNGNIRGYNLELFQRQCEAVSTKLFDETRITRENIFNGVEGRSNKKEE